MKDKFIKKYMRVAKLFGKDQNPCYSRQIGVIIVDPRTNTITGTGYNGPPPGTPHCDTQEYLEEFFWPQLTEHEKLVLKGKMIAEKSGVARPCIPMTTIGFIDKVNICEHFAGCGQCPRRLINAGPGERSDLCSCLHAERNAVTGAASQSLFDNHMFCWCGVPCIQCTGTIIKAGISNVYCLKHPDYHPVARWLFNKAGVTLHEFEESHFE